MSTFYLFVCLAVSVAHGSSWARDQTQATAVTMLDPQPIRPPENSKRNFFFYGDKEIKMLC